MIEVRPGEKTSVQKVTIQSAHRRQIRTRGLDLNEESWHLRLARKYGMFNVPKGYGKVIKNEVNTG